jgi:hypothetical protein
MNEILFRQTNRIDVVVDGVAGGEGLVGGLELGLILPLDALEVLG